MKKTFLFILLFAATALTGCQSSDNYDALPSVISKFISQYWPDPDIQSVSTTADGATVVTIRNSATITFDKDDLWTEINGNGMPLFQTLLDDQLPEPLYDYLESGSYINDVFSVSRTARQYTVTLLDTTLTYEIGSQTIRQN